MSQIKPLNILEQSLVEAQAGAITMRVFLSEGVAVASANEVMTDGTGFSPVILDKENVSIMACFTDLSRIGTFGDMAPYAWVMTGHQLIERIAPGMGLVINPGQTAGFDIAKSRKPFRSCFLCCRAARHRYCRIGTLRCQSDYRYPIPAQSGRNEDFRSYQP